MFNPCYILDEQLLRRNLQLIQHVASEADVGIILAFKAFALWKTFPIFREYIKSTTASSLFEARMGYEEFGAPVHTFSPAYTDEEIGDIARMSSHLTFNSLSQYERYAEKALSANPSISLGLRVNPEYSEIETDLYNPCAPGSRFGVTADKLNSTTYQLPPALEGFHVHNHCESSSEALERSMQHLEDKFGAWLPKLKWLNLGGGHLMTRKDYNVELLIKVLKDTHAKYPNLKIILEPGSAFAWQTGSLHSRVVDIVEDKGIKTAILNVSFTCHMPDCLEMPYKPTVVAGSRWQVAGSNEAKSTYTYRLGGNSCLSGDFMEHFEFDHELEIGEELIFEDMIHYTTVKTNMFNGIGHPSIAIRHLDGSLELLKKFEYEDYKNRMD